MPFCRISIKAFFAVSNGHARAHTYILSTNLVNLAAFAPALDLARRSVLPWVVKLAPVGVERRSVIRYYFTITSCLHDDVAHSVITPHGLESQPVARKGVRHLKKLALVGRSTVSGEEVEERHVDLDTMPYAGSAGRCLSILCLPQFLEFFGKRAGDEQMELLLHGDVAHSVGCAVLDHGGDVLEHPHAYSNVVGMIRKHAHMADVSRLVKTFEGLLAREIARRRGHDACLCSKEHAPDRSHAARWGTR